jgi:hypothetical protein
VNLLGDTVLRLKGPVPQDTLSNGDNETAAINEEDSRVLEC